MSYAIYILKGPVLRGAMPRLVGFEQCLSAAQWRPLPRPPKPSGSVDSKLNNIAHCRRFRRTRTNSFWLRPRPSGMPLQSFLYAQLLLQPAGCKVLYDGERLALAAGGGELDRSYSPRNL